MYVTDWTKAQREDPELDVVLQWLGSKKKADLRTLLRECVMSKEGQMVWRNRQPSYPSKASSIYAPPPKEKMRICYYL